MALPGFWPEATSQEISMLSLGNDESRSSFSSEVELDPPTASRDHAPFNFCRQVEDLSVARV